MNYLYYTPLIIAFVLLLLTRSNTFLLKLAKFIRLLTGSLIKKDLSEYSEYKRGHQIQASPELEEEKKRQIIIAKFGKDRDRNKQHILPTNSFETIRFVANMKDMFTLKDVVIFLRVFLYILAIISLSIFFLSTNFS